MRYLVVLFLLISANVLAQEVKPKGQFLADSLKIGQPVGYSLSLKYPRDLDILFPDSLYDFSPYELERKTYTPTTSDTEYSYDSAVYYLSSFEIDSVQYLKLPVFILHGNDSSAIYTPQDSIILKQLVSEVPDSVGAEAAPLIENANYINVPLEFNYPYFIIGCLIIIVAIILVFVFFGKRIKNAFVLRKLKKKHARFIEKFDGLRNKHNQSGSQLAEMLLIVWKKYLEKLEKRPYTKLTTKEIIAQYNPDEIANNLKNIDRAIYANIVGNRMEDNYEALKAFAETEFKRKIEEVKNG